MAIRSLVLAALLASAFSAHADVIPSTQSGFLTGAGNVLGALGASSTRADNLAMVAGITYAGGASLNANGLANALFGSASSNYGQGQNGALAQSKLYFAQGIEGFYLVSSARFTGSALPRGATSSGSGGGGAAQVSVGLPIADSNDIVRKPPAADDAVTAGDIISANGPIVAAPVIGANEVPEPATGALMLAGLAGVGFLRRRTR